MKRFFALFLLLLLPFAATAEDSPLDEALRKALKGAKTTGAAIVVAKDGEIVYSLNYGFAQKKPKEPVTDETYFRTASVTKMISGIHIMQLVEQGLLDVDTPIGDYLGYPVYNVKVSGKKPVTLRHLMSHTSSLSPNGGYTKSSNPLSKLLDATKKPRGSWYKRQPGEEYDYSNFGAGIMGSLMEQVTGKTIHQTVTDHLFAPLQMDAAYSPNLVSDPQKIVSQYTPSGGIAVLRVRTLRDDKYDGTVNPDKHYHTTVGSVWMRARDLCRIGMMMAGRGEVDGVRVLKEESVLAMEENQQGKPGIDCETPYGLTVYRAEDLLDGRIVYGHQGIGSGMICNLFYEPESRFVFALMTNGCNTRQDHGIVKLARKTFALTWAEYGE